MLYNVQGWWCWLFLEFMINIIVKYRVGTYVCVCVRVGGGGFS